jgi:hypothetical protein
MFPQILKSYENMLVAQYVSTVFDVCINTHLTYIKVKKAQILGMDNYPGNFDFYKYLNGYSHRHKKIKSLMTGEIKLTQIQKRDEEVKNLPKSAMAIMQKADAP